MKVLWLTNSPSNASIEFGANAFEGGWYSSLEALVAESKIYDLAVCFFYNGDSFKKLIKNDVVYFGVPFKKTNIFKKIFDRHNAQLIDEESFYFDSVINDFKPDLIHVFGTEMGYGKILMGRPEKVLFNLQGLIAPISNGFLPPGFNKFQILRLSGLSSIIRGVTFYHQYRIFKKKAHREKNIIRYWKYFIGRTEWDRNYVAMVNSNARYFHCEEMMRQEFFTNKWVPPSDLNGNNLIKIGTTINPASYKGLDLVYKVMNLLKDYNIQWQIFGINKKDTLNQIVSKILKSDGITPNIVFHGQVCAKDLVTQLKACHFFVHPSYIDNSPNSVCEAMVLGMPILSSSVGGIKTLIKDLETGFLFNPYDKYDLAGLLLHLIKNYEKCKRAATKARQVALKRHSPVAILSELNDIYNYIYQDSVKESFAKVV